MTLLADNLWSNLYFLVSFNSIMYCNYVQTDILCLFLLKTVVSATAIEKCKVELCLESTV